MQFVCKNCKAKYEIPEKRIQGRALKIRCRECGNVIEVKGESIPKFKKEATNLKQSQIETSSYLKERFKKSFTRQSPPKPLTFKKTQITTATAAKAKAEKLLQIAKKTEERARQMQEEATWYVAIKSTPVGPVNIGKIRGYIRRGELSDLSLVWKEGFNNWKPLKTVPELKKIYDEISGEIKQPERINMSERLTRAALQSSQNEAMAETNLSGKKETAALEPDIQTTEAPKTFPPPQSEKELEHEEDILRGFYVGRIEGQKTLPEVEALKSSYSPETLPQYWTMQKEGESLLYRFIHSRLFPLLGGALALLTGFSIMILIMHFKGSKNAQKPMVIAKTENTPVKSKQNQKKEDEVEIGDILTGLIITVEEVMEEEQEGEDKTGESQSKALRMKRRKKKESKFKTEVTEMPDVEERSISDFLKKKPQRGPGEKSPQRRNGLTDDQIRTAVKKNSKTIQRCYEKVLGKGMGINEKIRVKVRVKVGASGIVTKTKVIEITKYGNFLTPCIENGIRTWVFPKADYSSEFIFPILLTPKQ